MAFCAGHEQGTGADGFPRLLQVVSGDAGRTSSLGISPSRGNIPLSTVSTHQT